MIVLGIDPGLIRTGWGVIENIDNRLRFIAVGTISPCKKDPMAQRLGHLYKECAKVIETYKPQSIAFEDTFVNANPASALKLGLARGALIATAGLYDAATVNFYAPNAIKKAVTGQGHADKIQVQIMVKHLLPKAKITIHDEADALAIALCEVFIGGWREKTQLV